MVFICFAVYVLANNTRVAPYFNRRVWPQNMVQPVHYSLSTYTAKQMKTMYYSLIVYHVLSWRARARSTLAPYAFSKTLTSRNVRIGAGCTYRNRAIMHRAIMHRRVWSPLEHIWEIIKIPNSLVCFSLSLPGHWWVSLDRLWVVRLFLCVLSSLHVVVPVYTRIHQTYIS